MKIMISGGGTGGHIYPALALIRYIKSIRDDVEVQYVGTEKGLESQIVTKENIPFKTIEIQGFKRSLSLENIKTVTLFIKAIKRAKQLVKDFKPDIVIGTGGYVSAAVVYAASKMNIPTIVHEQNSVAGITNKFLAKYVDKVAICFDDVVKDFPEDKVVKTGNPRAQEVAMLPKNPELLETYHLDSNRPTILIFGGSRGAKSINDAFKEIVDELKTRPYQVLYVSGKIYYDEMKASIGDMLSDNVVIYPYIDQMAEVLATVDAVLARSGATTLAEITALGLPAILVPSPNVTNDHQTKNAKALTDANGAILLKDNELNGENMLKAMDDLLLHPEQLEQMKQASLAQGVLNSSERLYQLMQDVIALH